MKIKLPIILSLSLVINAYAGSATWNRHPENDDWNDPLNWTPNTVPNGPFDIATFSGPTDTPDIKISDSSDILLHSLIIDSSVPNETIIEIPGNSNLTLDGKGVLDSSLGGFGGFLFPNAGGSITFTKRAACKINVTPADGRVDFFDQSSFLGSINNNPPGGVVAFFDHARAGYDGHGAGIILNGGAVFFNDDSSARGLFLTLAGVNGDAVLDLSGHNRPGLRLLNLTGTGFVFLGANNLTLVSGSSSAVIQDGGESGGVGGSLTKVFSDNDLTLSGASTYTGGTNVNDGKLVVDNQSGSGTGTGVVRVNRGSLGGGGIIAGPVTLGTGRGVAILAPAHGLAEPLTLTILNQVTFNADGNYFWTFRKEMEVQRSDEVIAEGVTINGAMFSATGRDDGPLIIGTVFTAISNTSADPIRGTFTNLPDGTIIAVNGNNLQASYTGGDGNDLTLTVVP